LLVVEVVLQELMLEVVEVLVVIEPLVTDLVHYKDQHWHARQQEHIQLLWVQAVVLVLQEVTHLLPCHQL
tara:strand:+ start:533 stop:742 length:210 start_codon:yes stop_codon:yes gene_type:complete